MNPFDDILDEAARKFGINEMRVQPEDVGYGYIHDSFQAGARWAEERLRGEMEKEEAKVEIFNLIYGRWNSPYCVDFAQWLSTATTEAREALEKLKNFETTKEK